MIEVSVWSDIHCPWATVAVHRLRGARDRDQLDVVFDQRPWPLEFVNAQGTPKLVVQETAVLAQHEPDLFSAYRNESWPSTFLPAFELVAAARRIGGARVAEDIDYALRLAFFRKSVDVSIRAGLQKALAVAAGLNADLDAEAVLAEWDSGAARADVLADYERSKSLPIQGSPQVFWPDGTTTHNPGMGDHTWVRGIPRIHSADPDAPGRLLREKVGGLPHVD
jgi:predicted DsbA family dithiol-disulfide isomerase